MSIIRYMLVIFGLLLPLAGWSNSAPPIDVKVQLIQEEQSIQPGQPFWVALSLDIQKGSHIYWKNPGDIGMPLAVKWDLPPGFTAGELQWPFPEKFVTSGIVGFGYETKVLFLSQITPPKDLKEGSLQQLAAKVDWLVCSEMECQPGTATVKADLTTKSSDPLAKSEVADLFEEARSKLPSSKVRVLTKRHDNVLNLDIKGLDDQIIAANFFPEHQDVIDTIAEPRVTEEASGYVISLKGKDEVGPLTQRLKGVLVLQTKNQDRGIHQAIEIDEEIQENPEGGVVSWLEHPAKGGSTATQVSKESFEFEGGIGLALLFAFVGGMILNLMPCVLPVISLKLMSFIKMAGQDRKATLKHGLWFSFGVLASFWILAASILLLRSYGQLVGWGFQLQEPMFVVVLASIMFLFALSLFGVFEWGLIFSSWAGQKQVDSVKTSSGASGAFFSGVLATAVATPCTGPFLGSAVGFALTLPSMQALSIFTSLGLGMCFPYLLLSAFPSWLRFLPKPGAWMETFKQLMGFVLLASVVWLMWVFSAQTNTFSVICLIAGFLLFSMGAWVYGTAGVPSAGKVKRILAYVTLAVFLFVGVQIILLPKSSWSHEGEVAIAGGDWENFSPERVAELRASGTPVLIDFTAKWCLICQANHFVLDSDNVRAEMAGAGVVKFKADWTKNDPVITEELKKFGRNSVPLYVYYGGANTEAVILPQVLTPEIVTSQIKESQKQVIAEN